MIALNFVFVDLFPFYNIYHQIFIKDYRFRNVKEILVWLYVPFHLLYVFYLHRVVNANHVSYHEEHLLQKGESVIKVHSFRTSQLKLRDDFVAVRVEHPEVVKYFV